MKSLKWYDYVGWTATILVLLVYALGSLNSFAWANIILCVPVALPQFIRKAYSGVAISMAFGIISVFTLVRA